LALAGFVLLLLATTQAWANTRLAVIGSEADSDLIALLTARFSQSPGVDLVERAEIQRIVAEHQLQALASRGDFQQTGALLHAQGLIVLTRETQSKRSVGMARLIAVEPGVVVDAMAFPVSDKAESDAALLYARFGPLIEKVHLPSGQNALTISLLGLKFDVDSLQAKAVENQLNRLTADRLIHEPGFYVLERWRMDSLAWEKSLTATPEPFWTGSYLMEGSIHRQGKTLTLAVRLKKSDATAKEIQLSGSEEDLAGIAAELVRQIKKELGSQGEALTWDKAAEAENYFRLAEWAMANNLPGDAVSAAESAIALGLAEPRVETLRIRAYCMVAYPDDLLVGSHSYAPAKFKKETALQSIEAATEAVRLLNQFAQKYSTLPKPCNFTFEHPEFLAPRVLMMAFRVLRGAYENEIYVQHPAEVAALRAEVRQVGGLLRHAKPEGLPPKMDYNVNAPYWTETPTETLAVYRRALARSMSPAGTWGEPEGLRMEWSKVLCHYPCLDNPKLPKTHSPLLVAWTPEAEMEIPSLWKAFVEELKNSPSLQTQIDGLMFEYVTKEQHKELVETIYDFIWNHRAEIFGSGSRIKISGILNSIRDHQTNKGASFSFSAKLLCYLLEQRAQTDISTWSELLDPAQNWTVEEAQAVEPLITEYEKSLASSADQSDRELLPHISNFHHALLRQHPDLAAKEQERPGEIAVGHYWNLFAQNALKGTPRNCYIEQPCWTQGRLWFTIGEDRRICGIDPHTNDLVTFQWPENLHPGEPPIGRGGRSFDVTSTAVFLAERADVLCCQRATGEWKRFDLPPSFYMVRAHGNELYLPFPQTEQGCPAVGSGMLKLTSMDAPYDVLFSSRRTPAVSPLDGKSANKPDAVVEDRQGRIYFSWLDHTIQKRHGYIWESQVYQWSEAQKSWEKVFFTGRRIQLKDEHPGALIMTEGIRGRSMSFGNFDQVILLNPDSGQFELLLENPEAKQHPVEHGPRWEFPPELCRELPGSNRRHEMAWNANGSLWIISYDQKYSDWSGANYTLYAFLPGQKTAIQIPLRFVVPEEARKGLEGAFAAPKFPGCIEKPALFSKGVFAAENGLIITAQLTPGFWFLPYSEIPQLSQPDDASR
jgi:hypothetical protein